MSVLLIFLMNNQPLYHFTYVRNLRHWYIAIVVAIMASNSISVLHVVSRKLFAHIIHFIDVEHNLCNEIITGEIATDDSWVEPRPIGTNDMQSLFQSAYLNFTWENMHEIFICRENSYRKNFLLNQVANNSFHPEK